MTTREQHGFVILTGMPSYADAPTTPTDPTRTDPTCTDRVRAVSKHNDVKRYVWEVGRKKFLHLFGIPGG